MSPAVEARALAAMNAELKQQQQRLVEKGVMLEPFVHQVGGHSCVLRFGEQTICKPLIPREHQFYQSLPAAMRKFTPQYRGVVTVSFEEDEEGNLCLIAYPLHSDPPPDPEREDDPADSEPKSKMCKWGKAVTPSVLVESESFSKDGRNRHSRKDKSGPKVSEDVERLQQAEVLSYRVEYSHSSAAPQLKHNPWSLKCHQQHLQRMKENAKHRSQYKFILLENLTWQHTVPCVLDLKMGTRQHGDDASEEKKAMHMRKCEQSTSASIGVRLCGMQVYQCDTGQLMFMNKYLGRKLTLPGFKEALFQFFHSGHRLRHELLSPVLRRLRDMQDALESCESYRFYSSSLLIIYDGALHRKHARRRAEAELSEEEEEEEEEEPPAEEEDEDDVRGVSGAFGFPHSPSASSEDGSSCSSSSCGSSGSGSGSSLPHADSPAVDVRMIDFAHTTCRDFQEDSVIHEGGDSGYIFGLQNLITIISELESHNAD